MSSAKLSTARLVEQLQLTNERLERLEAEIRRANGLPSIEYELARAEPVPHRFEQPPLVSIVQSTNGASVGISVDRSNLSTSEPAVAKDALPSSVHSDSSSSSAISQTERPSVSAAEIEGYFRRADVLFQSGKPDAAVKVWQQLLKVQPENTWALTNIGIVYTDQARWAEAFGIFTEVARLEPDSLEAHYGLGLVYAQQGNYPAAAAEWEYVLRLQPDNEDARVNLSIVKERMAVESAEAVSLVSTPSGVAHNGAPPADNPASTAETSLRSADYIDDTVSEPQIAQATSAASFPDNRVSESETVRRALAAKAEADRTKQFTPKRHNNAGRYAVGLFAVAAVGVAAWYIVPKLRVMSPTTGSDTPSLANSQPAANNQTTKAATSPEPASNAGKFLETQPALPATTVKPEPTRDAEVAASQRKPMSQPTHGPNPVIARSTPRSAPLLHRSRRVAKRLRVTTKSQPRSGFNQGIDQLVNQIP